MVVNVNNNVSFAIASRRASPPQSAAAAGDTGNEAPKGGKDLPPPDVSDLSSMVERINDYIAANSRNLQFRVDNATKRTVITVVNPNNGEVIRQIPSEEVLRLAAQIQDVVPLQNGSGLGGLHLVDQQA